MCDIISTQECLEAVDIYSNAGWLGSSIINLFLFR